MPALFASYYEDFFIYSSDSYQIKALKLEILSSVATDSSVSSIFQELEVLFPVLLIYYPVSIQCINFARIVRLCP